MVVFVLLFCFAFFVLYFLVVVFVYDEVADSPRNPFRHYSFFSPPTSMKPDGRGLEDDFPFVGAPSPLP